MTVPRGPGRLWPMGQPERLNGPNGLTGHGFVTLAGSAVYSSVISSAAISTDVPLAGVRWNSGASGGS